MTLPIVVDRPHVYAAAQIAEAVNDLADVARLYDGAVGEIATYGGGRRVGGVRIHPTAPPQVDVHIVVRYGRPLPAVASAVREAISEALRDSQSEFAGAAINVHVADLENGQALA